MCPLEKLQKNYLVALSLILLYPIRYATLWLLSTRRRNRKAAWVSRKYFLFRSGWSSRIFYTQFTITNTPFRSSKNSSDANYGIFVPHFLGNVVVHSKCQITFASLKFCKWWVLSRTQHINICSTSYTNKLRQCPYVTVLSIFCLFWQLQQHAVS